MTNFSPVHGWDEVLTQQRWEHACQDKRLTVTPVFKATVDLRGPDFLKKSFFHSVHS